MNQETIVIDGVRYYADRPNSCRGCFFWKNRKAGCSLKKENCYYLAESPKQTSPCIGCCYGPWCFFNGNLSDAQYSTDTDGTLWRGRVIALFATASRNKIRERSGPGRKSEHTGYVQEPRKVILQIQ